MKRNMVILAIFALLLVVVYFVFAPRTAQHIQTEPREIVSDVTPDSPAVTNKPQTIANGHDSQSTRLVITVGR